MLVMPIHTPFFIILNVKVVCQAYSPAARMVQFQKYIHTTPHRRFGGGGGGAEDQTVKEIYEAYL